MRNLDNTTDKKALSLISDNNTFLLLTKVNNEVKRIDLDSLSIPTKIKVRKLKTLLDKSMFILDDLNNLINS